MEQWRWDWSPNAGDEDIEIVSSERLTTGSCLEEDGSSPLKRSIVSDLFKETEKLSPSISTAGAPQSITEHSQRPLPDPRPRLIVKLKYGEGNKRVVQRLLKLPPYQPKQSSQGHTQDSTPHRENPRAKDGMSMQ
ncbi:MAG: hypothetical protein Q9160_004294 [Pyrenula sp. 1 TL-2023]